MTKYKVCWIKDKKEMDAKVIRAAKPEDAAELACAEWAVTRWRKAIPGVVRVFVDDGAHRTIMIMRPVVTISWSAEVRARL